MDCTQILAKYRPNTKTHPHLPILPGLMLLIEVTSKQTERYHNSNCQSLMWITFYSSKNTPLELRLMEHAACVCNDERMRKEK